MMRGQKPFGAFRIRYTQERRQHSHEEPIGINPKLTFAPVYLFFPHRRRVLRLLRSF
jgi:hypothetical protein